MDLLPFLFTKVGRWWDNNAQKRRQEEIDILAFDEQKAIIGECKRTNEPVDADVYEQLTEKAALLSYTEKYLYLFAKRGFSDRCKRAAEKNTTVRLISFQGCF